MRISTKSIYESGIAQMNSLQSSLVRTQQQLSTNRRILSPSDDPIASSRVLEVTQSQSINTQLLTNRQNARNFLSQEELALRASSDLLIHVQGLLVKAGNASLSDADRGSLAVELEGRLADLIAQANTSDGTGGYLFSGFKSDTQPYSPTAAGVTYVGDEGQRQLQVGPSRFVATSDPGSTVFDSNLTGNGVFTTRADPANLARGGAGIISGGSVTNQAALLAGHKYEIDFTVTPAGAGISTTTYTVTDTTVTTPPTVPVPGPPQPFTSGAAIAFDGLQFDVRGAPANGDKFTVAPSTKESVFATIETVLGVLRGPGTGSANQAALTNGLNAAHDNLDTAFDNLLSVRAEVGSRMLELDHLDSSGSDLNIQYETTLSDLQDLDFLAASSLFAQQQTNLQAAQKSFTMLSGLSLFNYIS